MDDLKKRIEMRKRERQKKARIRLSIFAAAVVIIVLICVVSCHHSNNSVTNNNDNIIMNSPTPVPDSGADAPQDNTDVHQDAEAQTPTE